MRYLKTKQYGLLPSTFIHVGKKTFKQRSDFYIIKFYHKLLICATLL